MEEMKLPREYNSWTDFAKHIIQDYPELINRAYIRSYKMDICDESNVEDFKPQTYDVTAIKLKAFDEMINAIPSDDDICNSIRQSHLELASYSSKANFPVKNVKALFVLKKLREDLYVRISGVFVASQIDNIEVDGIDHKDAPDYCDAYIVSADYKGVAMDEDQINLLNEDSEFVYDAVLKHLS